MNFCKVHLLYTTLFFINWYTVFFFIHHNIMKFLYRLVLFVWSDPLRPSQQFLTYVQTGLPGLNQYFRKDKCVFLKDTAQWCWSLRLKPVAPRSWVKTLYHIHWAITCSHYIDWPTLTWDWLIFPKIFTVFISFGGLILLPNITCNLIWFDALLSSQQLWSCRDDQFS